MSANISHKYIESHWLIFTIQGLVALSFGTVALFTGITDISVLVAIASVTLLTLGTIEFFNLLYREHNHQNLGLTTIIALVELSIAVFLLFTLGRNVALHICVIACYTLVRGIFEIINALRPKIEATDRFIWLMCGICGAVFGFAILNAGHFANNTAFITYFGAYLMLFGMTNLFYGVHNRNEKLELVAERRLAAKNRRDVKKSAIKTTKSAKVSKPKSTPVAKAKSTAKVKKSSAKPKRA